MASLYWRNIFLHGFFILDSFLNEINKIHPNLSFTYETSKESVNFLILNVSLKDGTISADHYVKPRDTQQHLHCKSYSQALRLSRIHSSEKDFKGQVDRMKEWFLARDYQENVVIEHIDKVAFGKTQFSRKNSENGIPFVVIYHLKVKKLRKLIKDLLPFLYSDEEVQKVFSPKRWKIT